ncbi:chaperonin 10-like protein [Aspergillus pseudoustus]|uniref:Chaperonin 10-like protein n=1 Tax=Aspergillus pseudoustus TaxID=1810923 RepID=A0ABR4KUJ0_9EURO
MTPIPPPNHAAFLTGHTVTPLALEETDDRYPNENELVIRTHAVAINQIDWKMQSTPWTTFVYPLILGVDVAGEVVHVGSDAAAHFAVGDRVLGHALRLATEDDRHAGFQEHVVLWSNMAARIPAGMQFRDAAVLPLGVSTAAAALFQEPTLGLPFPRLEPVARQAVPRRTVLVWGGTSSVGSNAIQLAVAAGCDVVATASRRNFDMVRRLGAVEVVDYGSETVVEELKRAFRGRQLAGAFDAIATPRSLGPVFEAVSQIDGVKKVITTEWVDKEKVNTRGVETVPVQAIDIRGKEGDERKETVGWKVYQDFLPQALQSGKYQVYPTPEVVGDGLESLQGALTTASRGVQGKKLVVTIP